MVDGLGVGALPDAGEYGDAGANTLYHAAEAAHLRTPNLARLGLGRIQPARGLTADPIGTYGRMHQASAGKDSLIGHWELMGVITPSMFPTYPKGFPPQIIEELSRTTGFPVLGNVVASGTEVLETFGSAAAATGYPIVYTSSDSVLQMAAHSDSVPVDVLYGWCEMARIILEGRVARIIARPFTGISGAFSRLDGARRDFPLAVPRENYLSHLRRKDITIVAIGKVPDLFFGHKFDSERNTGTDDAALATAMKFLKDSAQALIFVNVSDADSKFAHRNDPDGWCVALSNLDDRVGTVLANLADDDVLIVTADHGNDPTTPGTDHTREFVPVLACSGASWRREQEGTSVGERSSFADVGATLAELLTGDSGGLAGESFADDI